MTSTRIPTLAVFAMALACASGAARAQTGPNIHSLNVVSLSASATQEVAQDTLSISMSTSRDGADAASVQMQLKQAVENALAIAKPLTQPGAMDVRTGAFSLYPRHDRQGKISSWNGSAEMVIEGKDVARVSATAGKVQSLSIQHLGFSLSREARQKVEAEVQGQAIAAFRAKAQVVSRQFGFDAFSLREVNVSNSDSMHSPRPRMMAMEMKASATMDSSVPVEAGKSAVTVMVSGTVVLR